MLLHDPRGFSDDENVRACWLRAAEWGKWPIFVSQPVVPLLYLKFPWVWVLSAIVILNVVWSPFRDRLANVQVATAGAFFARLKWITIPVSAFLAVRNEAYVVCVLSLLTPIVVPLVGMLTPFREVGQLQREFLRQLGCSELPDLGR